MGCQTCSLLEGGVDGSFSYMSRISIFRTFPLCWPDCFEEILSKPYQESYKFGCWHSWHHTEQSDWGLSTWDVNLFVPPYLVLHQIFFSAKTLPYHPDKGSMAQLPGEPLVEEDHLTCDHSQFACIECSPLVCKALTQLRPVLKGHPTDCTKTQSLLLLSPAFQMGSPPGLVSLGT